MLEEKIKSDSISNTLSELVTTVEKRTIAEVSNYLAQYISDRLDVLKEERETTEYDYCEQQGRMKELELLLKTIKELK
jgi:hypothetical protein